jgi:hypothetical protein
MPTGKRIVLTTLYRQKAADLGTDVRAENGVRVACDAIEGQLGVA